MWYDGYTDSVRFKLIREDYDITNLPTFDESSIANIENYRRLNTNELTNSVTVKYHDAALGASDTVTVHDLEASFRAGGVVSATFNYDGCPTLGSAAIVAERELVSLSRSVITFTVKLHSGNHVLGLGDPIVISYRDLGLQSAVMRVTRILYGDGTTGGISVDLVQDVFADLTLFGEVLGIEPYISITEAPPFVRLDAEVDFLEQGNVDLTTIHAFDNPQNRWIKAGVRYNPNVNPESYVSIDSVIINPSIGKLLTNIAPLSSDPRTQSFWIQVQIDPAPIADGFIRIFDEIFEVGQVRKLGSDLHEVEIVKRAQRDTVATPHEIAYGADVWFLEKLWVDTEVWDGSLVHTLFQSGVHGDVELLDPKINFIGRGNRPQPPAYVTVNNMWGSHLMIDKAFTVRYLARDGQPPASDQEIVVELTYNENVIFTHRSTPSTMFGQFAEDYVIVSLATLNQAVPTGAGIITLSVGTIWQGRDSWQKWQVIIDWSAVYRSQCGWNYDYGYNWGGANCGGFGYNYGGDYSN